jgi:MoxR-like ATPase
MSSPTISAPDTTDYRELIETFRRAQERIREQVRRVIVGQDEVVQHLLLTLLVGGHCLITGMPGTAKTLLVRTLATALGLKFKRIQFTPDLMPSDVTGTDIIDEDPTTGHRTWTFIEGPIFTNVMLADEVNRTPPKTQAALLEAMQELSVTVRGTTYQLSPPFFVLATQNPIELEGTYPLPEAQLDRFLFNVILDYLDTAQEIDVVARNTSKAMAQVEAVTSAEEILQFQALVKQVPIADDVIKYAVELVRASRPTDPLAPEIIKKYVNYGCSVRATQFLVMAAKARALMEGRYHVSYEDLHHLVLPVMRHRLLTNFHAESDQITVDDILKRLIEARPAPRT